MQNYGIIQNGQLLINEKQLEGYKPIIYLEVPTFDESTQYVKQGEPVEYDDIIEIGVEICLLELEDDSIVPKENIFEFVEYPPRSEKTPQGIQLESLESENAELIFQNAIQDMSISTLQDENAELLFRLAQIELGGM